MDIFYSVFAARLVFILGLVNLAAGLLLFFSCRCIGQWRLTKGWMKNPGFQRFFKYHCYLWWVLVPSVVVHAFFALMLAGIPF